MLINEDNVREVILSERDYEDFLLTGEVDKRWVLPDDGVLFVRRRYYRDGVYVYVRDEDVDVGLR